MKQLYTILLLVLILGSCKQHAGYKINGKLATDAKGTIYLQQRIEGNYVNTDSAELINGRFKMKGSVNGADVYYLAKGANDKKLIFLDNSTFSVEADSAVLNNAEVSGGEAQTLYNEYNLKYNRIYNYMLGVYYKARDEKNEVEKERLDAYVDSLYDDIQLFQETFVLDHPTSPVAAYLVTQIQYGRNAKELNELLEQLDTTLAYTQPYKYIVKRVNDLRMVNVGSIAPDFTQNDVSGNSITFSTIYSENELTLLDFWASWCGPCRSENPNLVKAYNKFHSKGFTVLGVSLDSNKERWLKAIEEDGLVWNQVSDLKGWENAFAKKYAVNSIPANFLVDKHGVILANNLQGDELLMKLTKMMK